MIHPLPCGALRAVVLLLFAATLAACKAARAPHAEGGLVGSWTLVSLEEGVGSETPHRVESEGALVLTSDGRMSVQVMHREGQGQGASGPVQYAQGGYEASFGRYVDDEPGRSFTYHVEGALVRSLVGKDMKRLYELDGKRLIVRPPTPDEHWRVTWERR